MRWIVLVLAVLACVLFAVGKWTRMSGRSPDERAGSDIPYLLGALLLVICLFLLAGWGLWHMFV
jgi:hypothetical protein